MVLNMPSVFNSGLFKISPEEGEGLLFWGNQQYPGDVTGPSGATGASGATGDPGTSGAGFTFIINEQGWTFPPDSAVWDDEQSGAAYSISAGTIQCDAGGNKGMYSGIISDDDWEFSTFPYMVIEFTSDHESKLISGADYHTQQFIGLSDASNPILLPDNGIGIYWDGQGGNMRIMVGSGGTYTSGATGQAVAQAAGADHYYNTNRIEMSQTEVRHYLNGKLTNTITTNIPTAALHAFIRADTIYTDIYGLPGENQMRLRDFNWWRERN